MKAIKTFSILFFGTILLELSLSVACADNDASLSDVTISSPNSPVAFGATLQASASASATDPSDTASELTITNRIWVWSATGGSSSVCIPTNGNGGTTWYWTNAPAGNDSATITASVTFQGTNICGGYSTNVTASNTVAATVVQVTFTLTNSQHIGISKNNHDRTKHFSATVTPSAEAANITLTASSGLSLSNVQNPGTGTINFDLVGVTESGAASAWVKATHSAGFSFTNTVTVIVPKAIGTPLPTFNGVVNGVNVLLNSSTSPAAATIPPPNVVLATLYTTPLSVPVVDQLGFGCGDLYSGAAITEGGVTLNQTLTSSSTYTDPVGPISCAGVITTIGSAQAQIGL